MTRLPLLLALAASVAFAQVVPEREIQIIQSLYDTGQYAEVVRRVDESFSVANFTDAQRVKLLELSAVSAFNTGDLKVAQLSYLALLKLNPDHVLDPFAVPPPAIRLFEQIKRDNVDALNLIRQQLALRAEQDKRAAEERARLAREEDERKRQQALRDGTVTVRTVEKRNFIVNLLPFGAGQFQQGRLGVGAAFVATGIAANAWWTLHRDSGTLAAPWDFFVALYFSGLALVAIGCVAVSKRLKVKSPTTAETLAAIGIGLGAASPATVIAWFAFQTWAFYFD